MSARKKGQMHLQKTRGMPSEARLLSEGKNDQRERQRCRYVKTDYDQSNLKSYRLCCTLTAVSAIKLGETGEICITGGGMSEWP